MARKRWLQGNHYEWMSDYLAARQMTGAVRIMMALIAASLAVCLLILLRFDGPQGTLPVAMTWTAVAFGAAGVALWAWRWPTHSQSVAFAVVSNAAIALSCLAYPDPQGALTGCISFATIAAYIAFFHSPALVLYNFLVTAAVCVTAAVRIAMAGYPAMAVVDLFIVVQINIAMPVAIHVLVRALGVDLARADRDPLTGLLNRRAFYAHTAKLLAGGTVHPGCHLIMVLVDLDDFKRINDTYGHQAGDETLTEVARALPRAVVGAPAVIGRIGGEEFVVAAVWDTHDPAPLAQRICEEIAALPEPVTASVGTACTPVGAARGSDESALERLVRAADAAMYEAKRAGGNMCHHLCEPRW
ncbi:GGDEF domain-containing protein [Mycolicibacterium litorale]|uniref:GGDEF domain-containing protein n=1 Tax=Mycolicibacterium litorale TaxID=758802 RepID=UPI0010CE5D56|nr:GGDEF domain-containing protein [Mycolicibacterium litorale]TDY06264.1 diguanylate cyclase [Mycolicibacterium litorale]